MTDAQTTSYVPGVCNINRDEIAYRRRVANISAGIFIAVLALLLAIGASRYTRILLLLPAFIAAVNYLQVRNKFCVMYGAGGQHNADEGSKTAVSIDDNDALAKDKRKARSMNLQALMISLAITALIVLFPEF